MDVLIGGIGGTGTKIKSLFGELDYSGINYHLCPTIGESKKTIEKLLKLDLMILSGWEGCEYTDFYKLSVDNPRISSILLIADCHQGAMNQFANIHPPSYTCYFGELERFNKERIDAILNGKNLDWSLY